MGEAMSGKEPSMKTCLILTAGLYCALGLASSDDALAQDTALPEYYVAPDGKADDAGTKEAPWDIVSALEGQHKIEAGATLWLLGGSYRTADRSVGGGGFAVKLAGAKDKPIQVRGMPGQRVTIDGGLQVLPPSTYLWLRDLEITVSERNRVSRIPGRAAEGGGKDLARPSGGITVHTGAECKFINLVIHGGSYGVAWWVGSTDSEFYGCLIYDSGWMGPDRGHGGHEMYTQNQTGTKTVSDCIFTGGYTFSMHAYGSSRAFVDNYVIEGNIASMCGTFLLGGESSGHNNTLLDNCFYATNPQVGYASKPNEGCKVNGNILSRGNLTIRNYTTGEAKKNLVVSGEIVRQNSDAVVMEDNQVIAVVQPLPKEPTIVLRPNKYDANRANLAIYNWQRAGNVSVDVRGFMKDGEACQLFDPRHFYGDPVGGAVCKDGRITVWMWQQEFAPFVVIKLPEPAVR
jgi:hypothetical protein